jgi:ribosomal protein S18 acetylase RimI-like enzyme
VIRGIDHVQLAAPPGCEEAARAFYGGLLGLRELRKPERLRDRGGVWFACGDQQLHVGVEQPFTPAHKAHPALAVPRAEQLSTLAEHLGEAGRPVRWDGPRIYTEDPFGNRLELLSAHARLTVRPLASHEGAWAAAVLHESWGADTVVGGGRELRPASLPGLVAMADGERAGLATYLVEHPDCELVTIDAFTVGAGVGGALVEGVADAAREAGCARVRLITTNDNLPALRLYQRHGFAIAALRREAMVQARELKPEIPATGHAGIPIRDELVLVREL